MPNNVVAHNFKEMLPSNSRDLVGSVYKYIFILLLGYANI